MVSAGLSADMPPDVRRDVLVVVNANPLSRDVSGAAAAARHRLRLAGVDAELAATTHRGHARGLGYEWARAHPRGAIVAVGGDGTLNEVAHGILDAAATAGAETVLAVCPAGNANDQARSWAASARVSVEDVPTAVPAHVDVLELSCHNPDAQASWQRYALSHAAIGFLATAATILNGRGRNVRTTLLIVPQTLRRHVPVTLVLDGGEVVLDSLSWHVVSPMAKHLKVAANACRDDGLMEVVAVAHRRGRTWARMTGLGARALAGMGAQRQRASMALSWCAGGTLQLDGETVEVAPGSELRVSCRPRAVALLCCRDPRGR